MNSSKVTVSISTSSVIKVLAICFLAYLLFYLRDVVLIILTAIVLATAVEPGTQFLAKRRIPRSVAAVLIYLLLIFFIAGFFYLILPYILDELASFMTMLPRYLTVVDGSTKGTLSSNILGWQNAVQALSKSDSASQFVQSIAKSINGASGSLWVALTSIFGGAVSFVLTLVIAFYLSVQERGVEQFLKLVTPLARERYVVSVWHRTQHKIGRWIQGQLILAVIVGVLVYVGLTIFGVKNALFLAFISTVFEIIPVFGPLFGSVPGVLVAFVQGGAAYGIVIAGMYLVVQQIESNVIYPLVIRKILDIPPLVVIIALVVGAEAGGFLGILLSVPVAVAFTEIMNDIRRNRVLAREKIPENNE